MPKVHEGSYSGAGLKFGIVVSRFNELISKSLLEGSMDCLRRHEAKEDDQEIYWVPGSFEIPQIARKLVELNKFDGIICLGAVIRGDTPHFDYLAAEVTKGIARVSLDSPIPVVFGILTADTIEQALERAGTKAGNRGWTAALNALELTNLIRNI